MRVLSLLILCFPASAFACRCEPLTLTRYFEQADHVFVGDIKAKKSAPSEANQTELSFNPIGTAFKGDPSQLTKLVTGRTSAECGVKATDHQRYLLFARKTEAPNIASIDTCSGTRPFLPNNPQPISSFPDVPAPQIGKALQLLSTRNSIEKIGIGGVPLKNSVIGLLKFQEESSSHPKPETNLEAKLLIRKQPNDDSPLLASLSSLTELTTKEISYETSAAIVYDRSDSWSLVELESGARGWIADSPRNKFHPLEEVLQKRLNYLTSSWDGLLWPAPGAGNPSQITKTEEKTPVEVIDSTWIANSLWFQLKFYKDHPCESPDTGFSSSGWIPAWNPEGALTTWFWSRGC